MTRFNSFRPQLDVLEGRALLSATIAAVEPPPAPYVITMADALISSATPTNPAAGKVSYSDLNVLAVPSTTPQTREHILLARQVGVPAATEMFVVIDGDSAAASDKKWLEIESVSSTPTRATGLFRFYGDVNGDSR